MTILFQWLDITLYRVLGFKEIRNKNNIIIRDNNMEGKKAKLLNMNVSAIFPSRIFFLRLLEILVLFYGSDSQGKG